ncbi:DNA polymerase III subunit gamma/tau [Rubritalea marina]|uniref:DNA polymerase III subunit gamma/tau n=1 Tax=Rubritalea marina TaxID=361055 RepID=UPI000369D49E|nr:DNA polymerase III subunit gamma/tau [Rubritalea marina]
MSYQVFARKYRPKTFEDVLGQDHVIQTLRNAIEQDRLAHAYLFVGPRGTGKTSTARILSKALNAPGGPSIRFDPDSEIAQEIAEGRSLDVIEIDGASNNGVEQVRELRDNVLFAPSKCRFKIYYIDEVHMLSNAAFNALLKTLEEPPDHVKFIFATTEPNKILPTIISRCQRFDLRPIGTETIAQQLQFIASNEGVTLSDGAAWAVAKGADGGMRDAQSMFDQLVAFCGNDINEANVLDVFGFTSRETVATLCQHILGKNTSGALQILNEQAKAGKALNQLLDETISCLRALLVAKVDANATNEGIPQQLWDTLQQSSKHCKTEQLLQIIDIFADTEARMKWVTNKKLHFEMGVIKAVQSLNNIQISDVIKALAGAPEQPPSPSATAETVAHTEAAAEAPTTEQRSESEPLTPQPEAPTTATTPEVAKPTEAIPESPTEAPALPPQEDPAPEHRAAAPSESKPEPDQASEQPKRRTTKETFAAFDNLIESAPEVSEQPPMPEPQSAPAPQATSQSSSKTEAKADPADESSPTFDEDAFYSDPLIKNALEIFEATIKPIK